MPSLLDLQARALGWLDRLPHRGSVAPHLAAGLKGEREALFALRRAGYTVVARRWTSGLVRGDLDLVAWQEDWLCFVEVKTRTARDLQPAESAVDARKQKTLRALAGAYLKRFPSTLRGSILVRFDIVSVYLLPSGAEVEIHPGAFPSEEDSWGSRLGV